MVVEKVYAQALFELANENGQLNSIFSKLQFAAYNIFSDSEFLNLLLNPNIKFDEKQSMLKKIFSDCDDKLILDFFLLLLKKNRISFINLIIESFFDMYYNYKNILRVKVISATKLSQNIFASIKNILEKKYSANIIIQTVIDKNIIGGFIIKIGETLIDSSIKFKLDSFKNFILELNLEEWSEFSV